MSTDLGGDRTITSSWEVHDGPNIKGLPADSTSRFPTIDGQLPPVMARIQGSKYPSPGTSKGREVPTLPLFFAAKVRLDEKHLRCPSG